MPDRKGGGESRGSGGGSGIPRERGGFIGANGVHQGGGAGKEKLVASLSRGLSRGPVGGADLRICGRGS